METTNCCTRYMLVVAFSVSRLINIYPCVALGGVFPEESRTLRDRKTLPGLQSTLVARATDRRCKIISIRYRIVTELTARTKTSRPRGSLDVVPASGSPPNPILRRKMDTPDRSHGQPVNTTHINVAQTTWA